MKNLLSVIVFLYSLNLFSTTVGGHISHNTTWSPENNPYEVVQNIFVDSHVTLTILPGTVIKFHGAQATYAAYDSDFYINGQGESVAKMIYVFGRIAAIGTEQDSITFTRYEEAPENMRWGNIVFHETAPESEFKHCKFLYPYITGTAAQNFFGCLTCKNGKIDVSYCRFFNFSVGIWMGNITEPILIYHNIFQLYERLFEQMFTEGIWSTSEYNENEFIVAYNRFYGTGTPYTFDYGQVYPATRLFEEIRLHLSGVGKEGPVRIAEAGDAFGNKVIDSNTSGMGTTTHGLGQKGYIKHNTIINSLGLAGLGNVEIADNYVENSDHVSLGYFSDLGFSIGDIHHNRLINTYIDDYGAGEIYNNVITGTYNNSIHGSQYVTAIRNNTIVNMNLPLDFYCEIDRLVVENNIFWNSLPFYLYPHPFTNMIFRNNCMSIAVPSDATDGGGNIIGQYPMFADSTAGDYHLLAGSPCIDAGFDTTGYYAMDMDYYHRAVDGNNDGIARIDMGAYEYGSTYPGGYSGHILFPDGTPVSLVKVDIEGVTREYTDSLGYFRFSAPAGTYTLYAHHIFLGDREYQVTINEQQTTVQDFVWAPEGSEDNTTPHPDKPQTEVISKLHVFPNPCNNIANIGYTLSKASRIEAEVYNVKGQRVRSLYHQYQVKGYNSLIWDGRDENGEEAANGIYYLRVSAEEQTAVQKLLRMR